MNFLSGKKFAIKKCASEILFLNWWENYEYQTHISFRAVFTLQLSVEINCIYFAFELERFAIGLARHFFFQSEVKAKPIAIHSHTFSRSLHELYIHLPWVFIGSLDGLRLLWLARALSLFWYYDTPLKTALAQLLYSQDSMRKTPSWGLN